MNSAGRGIEPGVPKLFRIRRRPAPLPRRGRVDRRRGRVAVYLPGLGAGEPLELGGLIPDDSPADRGRRSASQQLFSVPLTADTAVVERDPAGFSAEEQEAIVRRAVDVTDAGGRGRRDPLRAPDPEHARSSFPGSEEDGTTAVTHLFFPPDVSLTSKVDLARRIRGAAREGHYAGVTGPGPGPARAVRGDRERAPLVELGHRAGDRARGRADLPLARRAAPHARRVGDRVPRRGRAHPVGGGAARRQRSRRRSSRSSSRSRSASSPTTRSSSSPRAGASWRAARAEARRPRGARAPRSRRSSPPPA